MRKGKNKHDYILYGIDNKITILQNDSGVYSRGENSSSDMTSADCKDCAEDSDNQNLMSSSNTSIELVANHDADVCEVFCFLIKEQMTKCREAIMEKFGINKDKDDDEQQITGVDEAVEALEVLEHDSQRSNKNEEDQVMEQPLNLNALSESLPPLECPTACSSPHQSRSSRRPAINASRWFQMRQSVIIS